MKKICLLLGLFLVLLCPAWAQQKLSLAQQKALRERLRQDTLPFFCQRLPSTVNSSFSEYCPLLLSDSVFLFSSMRSEVEDDNALFFETQWTSRIYQAKCRRNEFSDVIPISKVINKSNYYHPNFTLNKNRDYMVFSRCVRNTYEELVCDLYESRKRNGKWQKPQLLGNGINDKNFTTTQPCFVELKDYAVLYFVSNRPNGQGDMDIWFSICKNGQYEVPINAGSAINTSGNEVTPFYDANASVLYFSSDEWLGIGGYDVFCSKGGLNSWSVPQNMGVPINSPENDFYFTVTNQEGTKGYFSSNRPIDEYHLEDTCCNDIFYWEKKIAKEKPSGGTADSLLQEIRSIFPITLYFDNDFPDPKTLADSTSSLYFPLLAQYRLAESDYWNRQINEEDKAWMMTFFQDSLSQCRSKLELLLDFLENQLRDGKKWTISIEGFASALHVQSYNRHLSQRRIVSVKNEMMNYHSGSLLPYIQKGQLKIQELPEGSANAEVNGDPVYGKTAVLQRKITLKNIEIKN